MFGTKCLAWQDLIHYTIHSPFALDVHLEQIFDKTATLEKNIYPNFSRIKLSFLKLPASSCVRFSPSEVLILTDADVSEKTRSVTCPGFRRLRGRLALLEWPALSSLLSPLYSPTRDWDQIWSSHPHQSQSLSWSTQLWRFMFNIIDRQYSVSFDFRILCFLFKLHLYHNKLPVIFF